MSLFSANKTTARNWLIFLCATTAGILGCANHPTETTGAAINENRATTVSTNANNGAEGLLPDAKRHDAEIGRLEKEVEKSPGDETAKSALAKVYLRRGDAHQAARQLKAALADYRSAMRLDPDNEEAQKKVAALKKDLGAEAAEEEDGDPAGLPPSPETLDEDNAGDDSSATPRTNKKNN